MAHRSLTRSIATAGLAAGALTLATGSALASGGWTYDDPSSWSQDNPACGGAAQSPIDLGSLPATREALPNPVLDYRTQDTTVVNNGHSIEAEVHPGSTMAVEGVTYSLNQFHFHAPSEHTVNGVHYPVEMHFVNTTPAGDVSVLAVFASQGKHTNRAWKPFVDTADALQETNAEEEATIDVRAMAPRASASYRYLGSLTTPPCTEGVPWIVLASPVQLSAEQIAVLKDVELEAEGAAHGNNRPVQPPNGRLITVDFSKGFGADPPRG